MCLKVRTMGKKKQWIETGKGASLGHGKNQAASEATCGPDTRHQFVVAFFFF